jgi:hypothetical protein
MLFLNFFEVTSGQNNPKNSVKKRLCKGSFKKSCFGLKISIMNVFDQKRS